MPKMPEVVVVHEGRGGYVVIEARRYPIEHVGEGRFCIDVASDGRSPVPAAHVALLEDLCRAEPEKWAIERRHRRPR